MTSIDVPDEVRERLAKIAKRYGISMGEALNRIVTESEESRGSTDSATGKQDSEKEPPA